MAKTDAENAEKVAEKVAEKAAGAIASSAGTLDLQSLLDDARKSMGGDAETQLA